MSDVVVKIIHRVSSRTFLGDDGPRSTEWLDLAQNYTPDISLAGFILDLAPPRLRPLAQWCIPAMYRGRRQLATARRLVASMMDERRRRQEVLRPGALKDGDEKAAVVATTECVCFGIRVPSDSRTSAVATRCMVTNFFFFLVRGPMSEHSNKKEAKKKQNKN